MKQQIGDKESKYITQQQQQQHGESLKNITRKTQKAPKATTY
jgi:hypothetical protein